MGCVPIKDKEKPNQKEEPSTKLLCKKPTIDIIEEDILNSGISTRYKFIRGIGKGGMGKVYLCEKGNEQYAIQRIIKPKIGQENVKEITENFHKLHRI